MLRPTPKKSSTITADSSEVGMAVVQMNAVRVLNRNRNSTTITSVDPTIRSRWTFSTAVSMKLAGRNSLGWSSTFSASQQRLELRQRLLQIQRHRARIGTELALDHEEHAGHAVDGRSADGRRRRLDHLGHIAQAQRLALAIGEQRARQLLGGAGLALDVDEDVLVGRLDETRRAHAARLARGFDQVLDAEPVAQELVGIGLDLPLAHLRRRTR